MFTQTFNFSRKDAKMQRRKVFIDRMAMRKNLKSKISNLKFFASSHLCVFARKKSTEVQS